MLMKYFMAYLFCSVLLDLHQWVCSDLIKIIIGLKPIQCSVTQHFNFFTYKHSMFSGLNLD